MNIINIYLNTICAINNLLIKLTSNFTHFQYVKTIQKMVSLSWWRTWVMVIVLICNALLVLTLAITVENNLTVLDLGIQTTGIVHRVRVKN